MGLLHRRTDLAVPHAHGHLWKVMAQLQTHMGKSIISSPIRFPESLCLIRFVQEEIKSTSTVKRNVLVYLVKCSREKNTHLLHPVGSTEGPAAITLQKNICHNKETQIHDVCAHFSCWIKLENEFLK